MNYFISVIKDNYVNFNGRARRAEYWQFTLVNIVISILLGVIDRAIGLAPLGIGQLFGLAILLPGLAVAVRRLHDIGKSGWYYLLVLLPVIGWIWLIVLFATEGDKNTNEYGVDPKGGSIDVNSFGTKEEFKD